MVEIDVKIPEWISAPKTCPNCKRDFPTKLESTVVKTMISTREGSSRHGDFEEAFCTHCDFILDRRYPNTPVVEKQDPYCSPQEWVYSAQKLERNTALTERESQVKALQNFGHTREEIASILDLDESTIREYSRRIRDRVTRAAETLAEMGHEVRLSEVIERRFDGYPVTPSSSWRCQSCDDELVPGDESVVVAERTNSWKITDIFCADCDREDYRTAVLGEAIPVDEFITAGRKHDLDYAIVAGTLGKMGSRADHDETWFSSDSLILQQPVLIELLR